MIEFATSILHSINPSKTKRERESTMSQYPSFLPQNCMFKIIPLKAIEFDQVPVSFDMNCISPWLQGLYLRRKQGDHDIFMKHLGRNWRGKMGQLITQHLLYENQNEHLDHIDIY
jgi:hypothetical protein